MSSSCLNCDEPVAKNYCPSCGQAVSDRRRSFGNLFGDFFTEFFALDGRMALTVGKLFVPGRLTQLYLEGKRASLVRPVRVYFVASLLFFLFVGIPVPDADSYNVYVNEMLIGRDEPAEGLGNLQLSGLDDRSWVSRQVEPMVLPKIDKMQAMGAQELLNGFFGGLERTIPTALIFFVPILAAGLKLLYIRRPFYYVDHLVFALHFQSFLFVLLVGVRLLNLVGLSSLVPAVLSYVMTLLFVTPLYLLVALRRVYRQGWILTPIKTFLLCLMYLVLIQPIMLVTFLLVIHRM